jgi:hypothetical protein
MFGFAVPAAIINLPVPVKAEDRTQPAITPRDVFEISLETAINALPMQYRDAAMNPSGVMHSLLVANAMAAAHVFSFQQHFLRSV